MTSHISKDDGRAVEARWSSVAAIGHPRRLLSDLSRSWMRLSRVAQEPPSQVEPLCDPTTRSGRARNSANGDLAPQALRNVGGPVESSNTLTERMSAQEETSLARAIHPFPARMAPEVALAVVGEAATPRRVLDPMCGSGTVLSLGVQHGHHVTGFDLDPLAVLMARVATQSVEASGLAGLAAQCLARARRSRATDKAWSNEETREFARYWFGIGQRNQLVRLSRAINELDAGPERDALQLCLSRLIVTKSPRASLAADTAHSRPHRVVTHSDYDVYTGFSASVDSVASKLATRELTGTATIKRGDARNVEMFSEGSFDLVVTSPPYLNAIDYLRGHRLALIWLGHELSDLRAVRSASIGSEASRPLPPTEANEDLLRRVLGDETIGSARIQRLVMRYAHDMLELASNVNRCLVVGGSAVVVVADSVLKGQRIPTGEIVRTALREKGMAIESVATREIPATLRYLPYAKAGSQLSKRMKDEYVVTARKVS